MDPAGAVVLILPVGAVASAAAAVVSAAGASAGLLQAESVSKAADAASTDMVRKVMEGPS